MCARFPGFFPAEQNRKVLTPRPCRPDHGPYAHEGRFGNASELIGGDPGFSPVPGGSFITGHELVVDGGYACMTI